MKFANALFWELVQNLPVLIFLVMALWLWVHRSRGIAVGCTIIGAVIVALTIRFTEPLKTGYHEPWSVTLVNAVVLSLLEPPFVVYLASRSRWSNWKSDLLLGSLAGVGIALAQGWASPASPLIGIILHSVALGAAGGVVLMIVRVTRDRSLLIALVQAVLIAVCMTLIIGVIDYTYLIFV